MSDFFRLDIGQSIKAESGVWYRSVQILGHGGNASTFLALATSGPHKGVLFAIKVFRKISSSVRKEAFLQEVNFLKAADHPSIMRVYDAGIFVKRAGPLNHEYPFVAAEYLPQTLADVLRAGSSSIPERISYALQLLSALTYLATNEPAVVHRDIKPQNIFVKGGSSVLGDFGLMKLMDTGDESDREVLKESEVPGMPFYYRTPDLVAYARKESGITPKSDVFQLGLVLTELFTGRNPGKRPTTILDPVELDPIGTVPGALGGGVAALLRRMLVFNPSEREAAAELMDGWQGVMNDAVERSHALEGRVFA